MKEVKGKRFIVPDKGWTIAEFKCQHHHRRHNGINLVKYFVNQNQRKIRKFFKKIIKEYL